MHTITEAPTGAQGGASAVVEDCARLRQEAANSAMTIATAIERAQWYRGQPETAVDPATAKQVIGALLAALERSRCYFNATLRGEDVFVLVEHDRAAPAAIGQWALDAGSHGCADAKVESALATAERWRNAPRIPTKWPD